MPLMRMNQAVAAALADELERDPDVVVFGEDVAGAGGPFKATEGLLEQFGALRVRDTPISEMGFLGAGVGAAATGLRPVVEIMVMEFLGVALDQLSTQAAKFHYLSGGTVKVPLTVRSAVGGGVGMGAQHSQTLETWLYATPGLKAVVPSSPAKAYGLLRAAIRDDNPVVVLEPKPLYGSRGEVARGEEGVIPLGVADVMQTGTDVTVVGLGQSVGIAEAALGLLDGIDAELIDLQTLLPWDTTTVLESVAKTGRLVLVEENPFTGGWGTEIASVVSAQAFGRLKAPVLRVTCPDVPVPFSPVLEKRYLPSPAYVAEQITSLVRTDALPTAWWEENR